jgi:hypothetical protein
LIACLFNVILRTSCYCLKQSSVPTSDVFVSDSSQTSKRMLVCLGRHL